jgi:hypothetical protein
LALGEGAASGDDFSDEDALRLQKSFGRLEKFILLLLLWTAT